MRVLLCVLTVAPLLAETPVEFFESKIRPVFASKCSSCHGDSIHLADLNLSTQQGFSKGSKRGPIFNKDAPAQSRLLEAISYAGTVRMPPSGKLAADQIADIKTWLSMGAPWPARALPASAAASHWSFKPVRDVLPPGVKNQAWVRTPVDRFILAKLEARNIAPAAEASKLTLLRRLTYDLTGLPPTPAEIQDFLTDTSATAYDQAVDRLLASPRYGERWGRNWLDVARYADSTGMDEDHIYPHAWRYRDYVVEAFNQDMPFDRFVREQIAGDLMSPPVPVATGFLALGPKPLAQQDRIKMIYDVVDEQIDTVSKALLGVTIACARCHDHKFDPFLTKDYYGLASIFASTQSFRNLGRPGNTSYVYYAPLDPTAYADYQTHRWSMLGKQLELEEAIGEDAAREAALLRPKLAALLTAAWKVNRGQKPDEGVDGKQVQRWSAWLKAGAAEAYMKPLLEADGESIEKVAAEYQAKYKKTAEQWDKDMNGWRRRLTLEIAQDRDVPARPKPEDHDDPFFTAVTFKGGPFELADSPRVATLRAELEQLTKAMPPEPAMASAVRDGPSVEQHVFVHGDSQSPGELVTKHFPPALGAAPDGGVKQGSGRLQLADWIANPKNPLTARVIVNRIWQGHFGEGLVRTPSNWGTTGEPPTHPELLDYLAARFVEGGWSIKALHRSIVLSSAYRMSTHASAATREADPANRLWSRFSRVRMSVEQIRDSFLALDGSLDSTLGGSLLADASKKSRRADADESTRRTLYIPVRRGSVPTVLATFDYGDATTPSEGRPRTNVAPQALFMMNSRFVQEHAGAFAKTLLDDASLTDAKRVDRIYLSILGRPAAGKEADDALSYIAGLEQRIGGESARRNAWQSFCHVLMSSNEFVYLN